MKNMTFKEKTLFIFLQIITLGLIWIYWRKEAKKRSDENSLSQELKLVVDVNELLTSLGGNDNVQEITNTHTKVKIFYKDRSLLDVESIKNIKGVSGVFVNDKFVVVIVGNSAEALKKLINSKLNQ